MQFCELTIEGFGPYAGREVIDFLPLSEKGLFSVTGETGAGKTTIFDALTFGLYGRLPGQRPETSVRSDHASARQQTQVELVFTAGNDRWKVVRSPRQERPKTKGTGTTEKPATAYLYRWTSGQWEAVANKTLEVNEQCRQLIGLDKSQFERVGLLPQGEFKKLLVDKSSDRKLLFRTLFGTDLVDKAVQALVADAKAADAAARDALVVHETIATEAAPLVIQLDAIELPDGVVVLETVNDDAPIVDRLRTATAVVNAHAVPWLRDAEQSATLKASEASSAFGRAGEILKKLTQREQKRELRVQLDQAREAIERNAAAAERSRRATPVVEAHRVLGVARVEREQSGRSLEDLQVTLTQLARPHDIDLSGTASAALKLVDQRRQGLNDAVRWSGERSDLATRVAEYTEQIASGAAKLVDLDEQTVAVATATQTAQAQVDSSTAATLRYANLVEELAPLQAHIKLATQREAALSEHASQVSRRTELDLSRTELLTTLTEIETEVERLRSVEATTPSLQAEVQQVDQHLARFADVVRLTGEVAEASGRRAAAAAQLAAVAARFARSVAPRLAADLVDGEPCSVCGSCDHPNPAVPDNDDTVTSQADVDRATAVLTAAASDLDRLEALLHASTTAIPPGLTATQAEQQRQQLHLSLTEAEEAARRRVELEPVVAGLINDRQNLDQSIADCASTVDQLGDLIDNATSELQQADVDLAAEDLQRQLVYRQGDLAAVKAEADRRDDANQQLSAQVALTATIAQQRVDLTTQQTRLEENARTDMARIAELEKRLAPWEGVDFQTDLAQVEQLAQALGKQIELTDAHERASTRCETLQESFDAAFAAAGFPTVEEALSASLPLDDVKRFEAAAETFRSESDRCDAALAQLAEFGLPDTAPDLSSLETEQVAANLAVTEATEVRTRAEKLIEQATALIARWEEKGEQFVALQTAADASAAVADLCNAKGASRIGLEGFILRQHLDQVVSMANLRLDPMSRGRYQLVVADQAIKGAGEWGLDLKVIDSHTGGEREVTTLSGGETFYTSLSLALGLSDVLSSSGATAINSVFIDEGFGSLDEGAIEDTIEMLNQLRSDGITIGVITHVGALRDALPAGIQVEKLASGGSRVVQAA